MLTMELAPILKVYGPDDLGNLSNFQGNYINFGYWKNLLTDTKHHISIEDRIQSSAALYDLIFNLLNIKNSDRVLEIGCGRGTGCATVAKKFNPSRIVGIDITQEQIDRANHLHKQILNNYPNLSFNVGTAEKLEFPVNSFDKIYSVEAAQHFLSIKHFAMGSKRVLSEDGLLIFAAHFATNQKGFEEMGRQDLFVKEGIDRLIPIQNVITSLKEAGFQCVNYHSIGEDVFLGYERWITQIGCKTPWSHNIYKSYISGYLDYYIIMAQ